MKSYRKQLRTAPCRENSLGYRLCTRTAQVSALLVGLPLLCLSASGCAAGVIGAVIGALSGGGGGGGGGPSGPDVFNQRVVPSAAQQFPCNTDSKYDPQQLFNALGISAADFVADDQVAFEFELRGVPQGGSTDVVVRITQGSATLCTTTLTGLGNTTGASHKGTCTVPMEVGQTGGVSLKLVLTPTGGREKVADLRINRTPGEVGVDPSKIVFLGANSTQPVEGLTGTVEFKYCSSVSSGKTARLVLCEIAPAAGALSVVEQASTGDFCTAQSQGLTFSFDSLSIYQGKSADVVPLLALIDEANAKLEVVGLDCDPLRIDNTTPRVEFDTLEETDAVSSETPVVDDPDGLTGRVFVRYRIFDAGSEPCDLKLSISVGNKVLSTLPEGTEERISQALTGDPLTDRVESLPSSPEGVSHVFIWNTDADVALQDLFQRDQDVDFRIEVRNSKSGLRSPEIADVAHFLDASLTHTVVGAVPGRTGAGASTVAVEQLTFARLGGMTTNPAGDTLFVTDESANAVWEIPFELDPAELPTTTARRIVGNGKLRATGDFAEAGIASRVSLRNPVDIEVDDEHGEIYLLERGGTLSRIKDGRYTPLLRGEVLVGSRGITLEKFAESSKRYVYIADTGNCRIIRYELPSPAEEEVPPNLVSRGRVIVGQFTALNLQNELGELYPATRNGCNAAAVLEEGDPDTEFLDAERCEINYIEAPADVAILHRDSERYLFVSQTRDIGRDGREEGSILRVDLGSTASPDAVPDNLVVTPLLLGERARCPRSTLISRPKTLRIIRESEESEPFLYIASDGVRVGQIARGVVVKSRIADGADGPTLDLPELVVGTIAQPDDVDPELARVGCACTQNSFGTYTEGEECQPFDTVFLANPRGFLRGPDMDDYILDSRNLRIRRVGSCPDIPDGIARVTTFLGSGAEGRNDESILGLQDTDLTETADGTAPERIEHGTAGTMSRLNRPNGLVFADRFTLFYAEETNRRVRRLDLRTGMVATIAGRKPTQDEIDRCVRSSGDGDLATDALFQPTAVAVWPRFRPQIDERSDFWSEPQRRVYVAERGGHIIRYIDADGNVQKFAGSGLHPSEREGCTAKTRRPPDVANTGLATTPANPKDVYIKLPNAMVVDGRGRLFIADCRQRILMVNREGSSLRRVIGQGQDLSTSPADDDYFDACRFTLEGGPDPVSGDIGDGKPAVDAILRVPTEMVFDAEEKFLYLVDSRNNRIRRVEYFKDREFNDPALFGNIITVAGTGENRDTLIAATDLAPALQSGFNQPIGVDFQPSPGTDGALLFSGRNGGRVYRVSLNADPSLNLLEIVAGLSIGAGGDGAPADEASLRTPASLRLDADGNVYVSSLTNHRIRRFLPRVPRT